MYLLILLCILILGLDAPIINGLGDISHSISLLHPLSLVGTHVGLIGDLKLHLDGSMEQENELVA
jgi:hypothetical protein